jgi:hypothetical protein
MKIKRTVMALLAAFVLVSCVPGIRVIPTSTFIIVPTGTSESPTPISKQPSVIHHTAPTLKVNTDWIKKAGCPLKKYYSGRYSGTCSSDSPLLKMGCEEIEVRDLFGGLPYPVVTCENYGSEPLGTNYKEAGCYLSSHTETLLTFRNDTYQFIGTEEIRAMSVPIESPDEALSYVLATTDYYALYDIKPDSYSYYLVDEIEETFVQETQNGYLLHLFSDLDPCGCGDHYTDAVGILVSKDGVIKQIDSYHFYKSNACAD